MQELFESYPEVLDTVSAVFAERQLHQKQFLEGIPKPQLEHAHETIADEIIIGIRNFFGLRRRH